MADFQLTDKELVVVPNLTDLFYCQQSGVSKRITANQILSNINNFSDASALDGTEIVYIYQGSNKRMLVSELVNYIKEEL